MSAERTVGAPAPEVYVYIADHRDHHAELPAAPVLRLPGGVGGVGTGTISRFKLTAVGAPASWRNSEVTEPEPGRVLTESDTMSSSVTTWTVTPEGDDCQVRIFTTWQGAGGVGGFFERLFAPRVLRRIYADELNLARRVRPGAPRRPGMMGQASRHVYISADMEGITGLVDAQDVQPGGADYERGRVMMTEDVNAAVGGALGVLSHSFMGHEIDARTVEVSGQLPDL